VSIAIRGREVFVALMPATATLAASPTSRLEHASVITALRRKSCILLSGTLDAGYEGFLFELLIRGAKLVTVSLQRLPTFLELRERTTELADPVRGILERILELADFILRTTLDPVQLLILDVQLLLEALVGVFLVVYFLGALVCPERHAAVCALHDDCRA